MQLSNVLFVISFVTLSSLTCCHSDHHNHHREKYSTESISTEEIQYESNPPDLQNGYESSSTNQSYYIGVPIGGIILLFLFCYCCYKCCCGRCGDKVIVQNTVVQPVSRPTNPPQTQIVQHIHSPPPPQPTQVVVQHIHAPAQSQYPHSFSMQPPQQQWQQQQWNQQSHMNQEFQQFPPPGYSGNEPNSPTAPPQYGKF